MKEYKKANSLLSQEFFFKLLYMYSFGGWKNEDRAYVFRIPLTLTTDWERLEDMNTADYDITVIPYN